MPRSLSPFHVPKDQEDDLVAEITLRAEAKKRKTAAAFDPTLGRTRAEAEAALARIRADIGAYGQYVYGYSPAPVHQYWNDQVTAVIERRVRQNKILILAPPNSAKSTWNSLIRATYHLGHHPDEHLLFLTSSDDMAKTFATSVRLILSENEKQEQVFPNPLGRPHKSRGWSGDGLYLRGTPMGDKDPAYKAVGWGMTVMGARANGIILDDVLDQKTAESPSEQEKARSYYDKTIVPRLHTHTGWLVSVMTRYAEGDLGGHFLKLAEESGDWVVIRTPLEAEAGDPLGRAPGQSLWPEQYPPEFIAATRRRMSIAEYDLVYNCNPASIGGDIFTNEAYFKPLPPNFWAEIEPRCFIGQAVDLAFSASKRAAFTVILTYAVDPSYRMYLLHVDRGHYQIRDTEERIKDLIRITKPTLTVIETENYHDALIRGMVTRMVHEVYGNIQLQKAEGDKITRARLPAGRAEHGMVFIDQDAPWYRPFMSEILGFPRAKFRDQVDALSLACLTVQKLEEAYLSYRPQDRRREIEVVMSA